MDMHSRYERDGMLVEEFHQLGEVGERAGQPVDLFKIGGPEYISHCDALRHPCFQQFDLNPPTMTLAGKSLLELVVVLPRCPLALGSCSSEAQFGFFQFGHAITFMIFAAVTRSRSAMHSNCSCVRGR
jgi:hypothetical protein